MKNIIATKQKIQNWSNRGLEGSKHKFSTIKYNNNTRIFHIKRNGIIYRVFGVNFTPTVKFWEWLILFRDSALTNYEHSFFKQATINYSDTTLFLLLTCVPQIPLFLINLSRSIVLKVILVLYDKKNKA